MSLQYRPEIDGLRAVAVLAVVLYHAELILIERHFFVGGFIGVDIFFVISGYLIASIILGALQTNRFSFLDFYERRARRILPVLFTVILTSIPFAWMYMLPKAMKEYAGSILSALTFGSNIWFWQESSYWAEPNAFKPFLHTWSLSVEEQFYVLFPIVLVLLYKFFSRQIFIILCLILVVSLHLAHTFSIIHPNATFYLLPTRGWEILAGAILAKLELDKGRESPSFLKAVMPSVGLLLIGVSYAFFDDNTRHPSYFTLIPVLGAMLIIWFCNKEERVTSILSSKPLVGIGLVSYGFYLWHFPVFAFARILEESPTQIDRVGWIVVALLLSVISYLLIEKPLRDRKKVVISRFGPFVLLVFVGLMAIQTYFYKTNGAQHRLDSFTQLIEVDYWSEEKNNRQKFWTHYGCWLEKEMLNPDDPFEICKSSEKLDKNNLIMVVGDSNIAGIVAGLIEKFGRNNIVERVVNGCLPRRDAAKPFCKMGLEAVFRELNSINPDLIIIGGRYRELKDGEFLRDLFDHELKGFRHKSIIFGPLPRWGEENQKRRLPNRLFDILSKDSLDLQNATSLDIPERLEPDPHTFTLDQALEKLSVELGVAYLSPVKTFCADGKCLVKTGNKPDEITTWDYGHLTHNASRFLVQRNSSLIEGFLK
ncbi:MAG: acyltransferase [Magnetococcales bacterium]|nr:acyltransferase [Magnetococcales bacterium]